MISSPTNRRCINFRYYPWHQQKVLFIAVTSLNIRFVCSSLFCLHCLDYDKLIQKTKDKDAPENTDDGSQDSDSPQKENVKKTANTSKDSVRTGDVANLALWMLIAVLAAAGLAVIMILKIRRAGKRDV